MGRQITKQTRIGKKERKALKQALDCIKSFRIFPQYKKSRETKLNEWLIQHLLQTGIPIAHLNIPDVTFLDETFRPEAFLKIKGRDLLGIECKKVTDSNIKRVWKEGLSQALVYSTRYKHVAYVLYDYTKNQRAKTRFGPGNKPESTFAAQMPEKHRLHIIVLALE